ncbi:MAG: hypothetical protein AAFY48_23240, partial [Bacteroidota bacterium]
MKSTLFFLASLLFLWLNVGTISAQTAEEEALANLLKEAWSLRDTNPTEARTLITEAFPSIERLKADNLLAKYYYTSATLSVGDEELLLAQEEAGKALLHYEAAKLPAGVSLAYELLANIAKHLRDYPLAFHYYQEQINLIHQTPDIAYDLPYAYMGYSTLFQDMNVNRPALEYIERADKLLPSNDPASRNRNKLNQANIYLELSQLNRAQTLAQEAETFYREQEDADQIAKCRSVVANVALF